MTDRTFTHSLPQSESPPAFPSRLDSEVADLMASVLKEAESRGHKHVSTTLGARPDNHPTRLILEELIERLQETLGHSA